MSYECIRLEDHLFSVKNPFSYQEQSFIFTETQLGHIFVFAENLNIGLNLPQLIKREPSRTALSEKSKPKLFFSFLAQSTHLHSFLPKCLQAHISIQCSEICIFYHYFISTFFLPQWFRMATKNTRINYVYKIFLLIHILAIRRA